MHREKYNKQQDPPVIEKRTAVGSMRSSPTGRRRNVPMIAVLCNGVTVAQFLSESEADDYINNKWPRRVVHGEDSLPA